MKRKAQAGLEYLITYGWALVLIAAVVGVFVFIASSPASGITFSSSDPAKILLKAGAVSDSSAEIRLQNITGGNIEITGVVEQGYSGCTVNGGVVPVQVGAGGQIDLECTAPSDGAGTISLEYTDFAGLQRSVTVTASGTATPAAGAGCTPGHTDNGDGTCTAVFSSAPSDGRFFQDDASYNIARDSATGYVFSNQDFAIIGNMFHAGYGLYNINRSFVFFDTSSIPVDAAIDSTTLSLYGWTDYSSTDFDIVIQNGQPTYPHDPLEVGDYDRSHYSGNGGSFNTAGFTTSGYNDITLNASGISWINKSGTTKFCLRNSRDIAGITPTGEESISFYTSENGSLVPTLTVTYTP